MSGGGGTVAWKHIGLHGHSVGTFACTADAVTWKSAASVSSEDTITLPPDQLKGAQWTVFGKSGLLRLQTTSESKRHELRFDGFPVADFDVLRNTLQSNYSLELQPLAMSSAGTQYGRSFVKNKLLKFQHVSLAHADEEGQEFEVVADDEMMSLDLHTVSQCVLPGNNRNEIEVQFPESDTMEAGTDQLVAIRLYIPPDPDADPADKEAATAAELLQQKIMTTANIRKTTGDVLVSFEQKKGAFLTPRGRYGIELYDSFLRMRGQKYDYKIRYDDINRLFLLPKPDEVHMAFVIALDKPIRQGQQRYQFLVMQITKDPDEVTVNLDEDTLEKEYNGELQPVMRGSLSNLIAKTFKVIARKKVFIPGKFANANQQACLNCSVRANEGLLYPLEKQFVFIHKPPIIVRFNEIDSVEFQRYAGGQGSTRNFDLCVNLKTSVTASANVKDYTFSGIDRSDYAGLYNFLSGKKIPIKNLQNDFMEEPGSSSRGAPVYNEDEIFGNLPADGDEAESDDESYGNADAAKDEVPGSSESDDMDDDEMGSEVDEELDSDLEEARGKRKKSSAKPKKKKTNDSESSDDSDDEKDTPKKKTKKTKAKKDPNAPKRAISAYFFFMGENRERIKKENPDAPFTEISKMLGAAWKSLSADEKAKYEAMNKKDKERYKREMADYTPADAGDGKKKKAGKKKKDPNAPKRAASAYLFFSNEQRAILKKKEPSLSFGEVGKRLGEMYKELTPDEKKKYEDMAEADKKRYKKETAEYESKKQTAKDDGVDDSNDSDDDSDSDDSTDDDE